jgi:hypothetical protein
MGVSRVAARVLVHSESSSLEGTCTMRTLRQRLAAVVAMALLGVTGLAVAAWSPASMGLVTAVSADDDAGDDDGGDGDDDDGGQAPAGGVDTGLGGTAGPAQDGDDDADDDGSGDDDGTGDDDAGAGGAGDDDADDGGQVPAGGVDTGQGGANGSTQDGDDDAGDDDGGDGDDDADDGGQVPAGGVDTGQGGTADAWSGERVSNDRSVGDVASLAVPAVALGLGGLVVGRLVLARLRGSQG